MESTYMYMSMYVRCVKGCRLRNTLDVVFIYAFSIALCGAPLVKTPSNKAVIKGKRMEMECQTGNGSLFRKWDFLQVGSDTLRTIAINDNLHTTIAPNMPHFGLESHHKGSTMLYSNSTESNDAGVYICQGETGSTEFKYSAQMIVLETQPICETNMTAKTSLEVGDYIWMQCRVQFRGNWAPTMEWRQHEVNTDINEGRMVSDVADTVVIQNSSITSTLIVLIDSTNYDSYFSCQTYFTWHDGTLRTNATNVPDFNHTWISIGTLSDLSKTTTLTDANDKSTTDQIKPEFVYLLFGVLSAALFLMIMATAAICCIIIRRKTAEMMANVVSKYENRERPRSARNSLRFAMDTLRRHTRTMSSDGVERRAREPSEGYTSVDDLAEECNQAIGNRPTTSGAPQYGAVLKKRPPGVGAAAAGEQYSLAKEETLYYATLRKNIEPPNWRTNDDGEDSDSESEDLK